MRTSIISTMTLASLACVTLLYSAEPAAARTCSQRVTACSDRCHAKAADAIQERSCNQRTCLPQYKACMSDAAGGGDRPGADPKGKGETGPIVRDKRKPRGASLTSPSAGATA